MKNSVSPLAKYASIGYYLVTPLLLGVFLGVTADTYFKTKPILTLIGIFGGVALTFYNLIKTTRDKDDNMSS